MDALEIKEVAGLRDELDQRATTQYVDGSDLALQLQIDAVESDLVDLENEVAVHETRLDGLALRPVYDPNHQHTSGHITDFREAVEDTVAEFMRAGGGVTLTYDDASNTYTISSSPGETFDPEKTRDAIGAALVPLGLIDIAINDALDTISTSTRATQNSTDAELRRRDLHTGEQGIDTVTGLSAALANKTNNATTAALSSRVGTLEQVIQPAEVVAGKEAFIGLTPRAALLQLINQAAAPQPTTTPLAAPGNLSATAQSSTTISFVYSAVVNASSYQLQYATDAAFTQNVQTVLNGPATSYLVNGLASQTTYHFRVMAVGGGSYTSSGYSAAVSARTLAPAAGATPPAQVTGLSLAPADTTLTASWNAPADGGATITDYRVEVRDTAQNGNPFVAYAHAASAATSLTITGLANGGVYQVRVAAVNSVGTGAFSDVAQGTPRFVSSSAAIDHFSNLIRYEASTFNGSWNFLSNMAFISTDETGQMALGFTGAALRLDLPLADNGCEATEIVVNNQVVATISQRGLNGSSVPYTINVAGNTGSNVLVIRRGALPAAGTSSYLMVNLFTPLDSGGFYRV